MRRIEATESHLETEPVLSAWLSRMAYGVFSTVFSVIPHRSLRSLVVIVTLFLPVLGDLRDEKLKDIEGL